MARQIELSPALKELKRLCKQQVGQLGMTQKRIDEMKSDPDRCEATWKKFHEILKRDKNELAAYQRAYKNVQWAEKNT